VHPRSLRLVDGVPVHKTRGGFQNQKTLLLEAAVKIVDEPNFHGKRPGWLPIIMPRWVAVPCQNIHMLSELAIIKRPEWNQIRGIRHEVRRARNVRCQLSHGLYFMRVEVDGLVADEPSPIQIVAMHGRFA